MIVIVKDMVRDTEESFSGIEERVEDQLRQAFPGLALTVEMGDLDTLIYRLGMCYGKLVEVPEGHVAKPELHLPLMYDPEGHICESSCRGLFRKDEEKFSDTIDSWVLEKAIRDIKPGEDTGREAVFGRDKIPSRIYDYSHVVPHQHQHQYRIEVHERPKGANNVKGGHWLEAFLIKHPYDFVQDDVGKTSGMVHPKHPNGDKDLRIGLADVDKEHRGKGFGMALYEALYAHAKHYHGATHVGGGAHSSMAHNAHLALSKRHGMEYEAHYTGEDEGMWNAYKDDPYADPDSDAYLMPGERHPNPKPFDDSYGPYMYAIKSEDGSLEILSKADRNFFKGAAFRLKGTDEVYNTGAYHNIYELPAHWKVDEGHTDHIEAGFVDHSDRFYTRAEAAELVHAPKKDLQSEDLAGMGRKAGEENIGSGAGLVKAEPPQGPTYYHGTSRRAWKQRYKSPSMLYLATTPQNATSYAYDEAARDELAGHKPEPVVYAVPHEKLAGLEFHPDDGANVPGATWEHTRDSVGSFAVYGHIDKYKPHFTEHPLMDEDNFDKSEPQKTLHKMAIADIPPGAEKRGQKKYGLTRYSKFYDYQHVLSPLQKRHYYLTIVNRAPSSGPMERGLYDVRLYSRRLRDYRGWPTMVGNANVRVHDFTGAAEGAPIPEGGYRSATVDDVHIHPRYRNKGLGLAIYEAAFAHAKHAHGATHVSGGEHSTSASGVHRKLAEKHGLKYNPVRTDHWGDSDTAAPNRPYDNAFSPYSYELKAEMPMNKMALADIKPGKQVPGRSPYFSRDPRSTTHDYSHVLPMRHAGGYEIHVHHSPDSDGGAGEVRASLVHTYGPMRTNVGYIDGSLSPESKKLHIYEAHVDQHHRNKGLGTHLYEALLAHAFHNGVNQVEGGLHSSMASRSHQKLSEKHGFNGYKPEESSFWRTSHHQPQRTGDWDAHYGNYGYTLKSDDSWLALTDNLSTTISDDDAEVVEDMAGFAPRVHSAFDAARFLVNGEPLSLDQIRRALWLEDGDFECAALRAYQITVDDPNLKALRSIMKMGFLKKSIDTDPSRVECPIGLSSRACQEVQAGISRGMVQHVNLNGKYSRGSMVVRDPKTQHVYLLKPDSDGISPAAGVAEQKEISQPRREACFWQIANMLGMGDAIPRADLIILDGQEWAAIRLLPFNFKNLEKRWKMNQGEVMGVLERYRASGLLHKWAILDYILGNPDRHGQNLMIGHSEKMAPVERDLMLIDHGSAFAGYGFAPSQDSNSFIPFYLRAWASPVGFNKLTADAKLRQMPTVSHEVNETLKRWIHDFNPTRIANMAKEYGIDPGPIEARVAKLKMLPDSPDIAICKLWAGAA